AGSARIIDFIKVPLRDADGWAKGLVVLGYDLTERNRLEAEILRVSEREQRRIGQDLHDGLGQQLTAIEMMCQSLKSDLAPVGPGLERQASRICQCLREGIAQTRSLAHGLTAFRPGGGGLQIALEELARTNAAPRLAKCCCRCCAPVWLRD